jgi:hypothetical protein
VLAVSLVWAHVPIGGLLLDVAGAIALGLAFATKKPEDVQQESPVTIDGGRAKSDYTLPNPFGASLIRQRAEARLGLFLLVAGFVAQGAGPMFNLGSLATASERSTVIPLALVLWSAAYLVGWRWLVARDERRTTAQYVQRQKDHLV